MRTHPRYQCNCYHMHTRKFSHVSVWLGEFFVHNMYAYVLTFTCMHAQIPLRQGDTLTLVYVPNRLAIGTYAHATSAASSAAAAALPVAHASPDLRSGTVSHAHSSSLVPTGELYVQRNRELPQRMFSGLKHNWLPVVCFGKGSEGAAWRVVDD